jgi:hypothetical protein
MRNPSEPHNPLCKGPTCREASDKQRTLSEPKGKSMTDSDASILLALQPIVGTEGQFKTPESRRAWLLLKALEHLPLPEALELAEAADSFVSGGPSERSGVAGVSSRLDGAKVVELALPAATASDGVGAASNNVDITDHGWCDRPTQ